jgi:hypothetical protein
LDHEQHIGHYRATWEDWPVIPTMLLVGLVAGRAWIVPLGAAAWAALLLLTGTIAVADVSAAALLGGVNTLVGVAVHRALMIPFRRHRAAS